MGSLVSKENLKISGWFQLPSLWLEAQSYLIASNNFYSPLEASAGQSSGSSAGQRTAEAYKRQPGPRREEAGGRFPLTWSEKGRKSGSHRSGSSGVLKQGRRPPTCFDFSGKCLTGCLPFLGGFFFLLFFFFGAVKRTGWNTRRSVVTKSLEKL